MRPSDPRIRQTLNQISQNLESANLTTQASLFSFSEKYINPCLASVASCFEASCQPCYACIAARRDGARSRHFQRTRRGRDNLGFDFYDDWDEEEGDWGNDELDRLLAGPGEIGQQPRRKQTMNYGTRLGHKSTLPAKGGELDANVVPKSSVFGFLEGLPWKIGGRGRRYRPSAADLHEHVGGGRFEEAEPFMEGSEGHEEMDGKRGHRRNRSDTVASKSTTGSLSSRGDLFTSEGEDDAVLLDDDEFGMALERRTTGTLSPSDDRSSKKSRRKRLDRSQASTKTGSSRETRKERTSSIPENEVEAVQGFEQDPDSSLGELKREEEQIEEDEERDVESKRQAATQSGRERDLVDARKDDNKGSSKTREAVTPVYARNPATTEGQGQSPMDRAIPKEPE